MTLAEPTQREPRTQPTAAGLRLEGISKSFGRTAAVADATLTVGEGEIVCLLGPSGCGKTTTLRIAAGIERPDAGTMTIDGRIVAGPGVFAPPEQRGIGLIFQDYALFPHLTALANVAFGLASLPASERRARAMAELERVKIAHLARKYPHELSGGEQQRVALARALAPAPRILLMDEPFSNLDKGLRATVRDDVLSVLRAARPATLIVTHEPEEALQIADRIAIMRRGRIVQAAAPETVWRAPVDADVASFLGEINTLPATASNGRVATPWGSLDRPDLKNGPVQLLVRPSELHAAARPGLPHLDVEAVKFTGTAYVLEGRLEWAGGREPFRARLALSQPPRPGARIGLECAPNAILIFSGQG